MTKRIASVETLNHTQDICCEYDLYVTLKPMRHASSWFRLDQLKQCHPNFDDLESGWFLCLAERRRHGSLGSTTRILVYELQACSDLHEIWSPFTQTSFNPCTWWWSDLSSCPYVYLYIILPQTSSLIEIFCLQTITLSLTWAFLPHPTSSWWLLSRCWKMNYPSIPSSTLWHHCCPVLFPISSRGTQRCASPQPEKSPHKIFDVCSFDVIW